VLITRERKLQKLSGRPKTDSDPEVSDWISDIRLHIVDLEETQKIDTILGFLAGEAKSEVKLYPAAERDTADKILNIIETLYKDVDDLATLHKNFYDRLQGKDESLQSYSLSLLKLRDKIQNKSPNAIDDVALKTRFIEGIYDASIKRDLRRFSRDKPDQTFVEFRRMVLEWLPEEPTRHKVTAKTSAVTVETLSGKHEDLAKSVASIQQKLDKLLQKDTQKPSSKADSSSHGDSSKAESAKADNDTASTSDVPSRRTYRCWKCGKLGHIAKYHRDDYKKKTSQNQEN
jgi:hypothetical protein